MLGNFLLSADVFSKLTFSNNSFRNTIRVSNSLNPDQARLLSGLILVQTVCKGYQQTTKSIVSKELKKRCARKVQNVTPLA